MEDPEKWYGIRLATDPFVYNGIIYFTENWIEGSKYRSSIYCFDGKEKIRLTFGGRERYPQINNEKLFYIKYDESGEEIMVIDGLKEPKQVFNAKVITKYVFHGDSIAVICKDQWNSDDPFEATTLRYRADSKGLLRQRQKLLILYPDGSSKTAAEGKFDVTDVASNGKRLVFASTEGNDDTGMCNVFEFDDVTGQIKRITSGEGSVESVCLSDDGKIAYTGNRDGLKTWTSGKLIIPEEGRTLDVENTTGNHILSDLFAAGSGTLLYSNGSFYTIGQSGASSHVCRICDKVERITPDDISVSSFDIRDGILGYIYSSFEKPCVIVFNGILDLNPDISGKIPEHMNVDGMDAWIMLSGKDKPSILSVHGGPHTAYGNSFFIEFNYLFKNGFNIIFGNPRGSAGYGDRFAEECVGDWGGMDFLDLISFIDHAKEKFGLKENFSITGGSYGGFMVNNAIVKTDRFRCAIAERCVSNLMSMCGTSDIGFWFNAVESGIKDPWSEDGMKRLLELSPISKVKKVKTPTMFLHGENDYRCPIEQSEQMYTSLLHNGVPAVLVRYQKDSHEHARHGEPKNMVDRLKRKVDWFRKYQCLQN
ncbi:MAG: S9 family peptidase [Candidatus Thermoplasmatota archaeon]|nr:S9 family peptidase [Candidatus Thermoplasmatota archaeon]